MADNEFPPLNTGCCASFPPCCQIFFSPLGYECSKSHRCTHLLFRLQKRTWKKAFGQPSSLIACCTPVQFFAIRVMLMLIWLGVFVWSLAVSDSLPHYTIYLTNWTLMLELFYFMCAAFATGMAIFSSRPDGTGKDTPWFVRLPYALQPVVVLASMLVFLLYWLLVYDGTSYPISPVTHGVNFLLALIDLLICRNPLYCSHILMPMLYSLIFIVFSLVYWSTGGLNNKGEPYIYAALDWSNFEGTARLTMLILLLGVPFLWAIVYCIYLARRYCRIVKESEPVMPVSEA